jgi:ketosteroid isomerase-like protein
VRKLIPVLVFMASAVTTACAQAVPAQSAADSIAVAGTIQQFHAALASGDSVAALGLLTEDCVVLEAGILETRAEYRAHHLAADLSFAKAVPSAHGPTVVSVQDGVAWAITMSASKGTLGGRPMHSASAELAVLTHQADGWRIRAIHWSSHRMTP